MSTAGPRAGHEPDLGAGGPHRGADALIAEARRHRRRRWRRRAVLAVIFILLAAALAAGLAGLPGRAGRPAAATAPRPPGHLQPMPPLVVVWTGSFRIEVLSPRTGRVLRTLAAGAGLYRGLPTVAVSATGMVYFDTARRGQEQVMSVPLAGGPVTTVAAGRDPAVSPDGRMLAYVTDTDLAGGPEAIVVQKLATGTRRRWAFTSAQPDIDSLSWSPGSVLLSFTASTGPLQAATAWLLDTRRAGTLNSARPIPLGRGLQWAGFLTPGTGMAVAPRPGQAGRDGSQALLEVAVSSGQIVRQLTPLPAQALFTANTLMGTEGTITADPGGHYLLIATAGPDGHGEIFRWTVGTHQLVPLARGAIRASWAG